MQQLIDQKKTLERLIASSHRIAFFGGAGVSTESGIPDFRGHKGLYNKEGLDGLDAWPAEMILSRPFFFQHTEAFFQFYRSAIIHPEAKPNPAHVRLAALEKSGQLIAVITQNIDGLHQAAGSRNVLELHGSVHRNTCLRCRRSFDCDVITRTSGIPRCQCGGLIKPDIVLYGEPLDQIVVQQAAAVLQKADLLIIGGTSLSVYPAAGLIDYFQKGKMVLINKTETSYDYRADVVIRAPIGSVFIKIDAAHHD